MKELMERMLRRMFGQTVTTNDPAAMNDYEKHEAVMAAQRSGAGMRDELADDNDFARREAADAMAPSEQPMTDDFADSHDYDRRAAQSANEQDGSYLKSELADDAAAEDEARQANPHEAPKDDLADDTDTAKADAERANEPAQKKGDQ